MVIFHADDYGIFPELSNNIFNCIKQGALNSVSIMSNSRCFDECMSLLEDYNDKLLKTIHLNVVEGYSLSSVEEVPGLVDENGMFTPQFAKKLLISFIPWIRKKYFAYFYSEIDKQVERALPYINPNAVRLDSHGHYHMLPVFFDAMMKVVEDRGLNLEYVRMPREVVRFYKSAGVKVLPINMIKVAILNLLYEIDYRKHKKVLRNIKRAVFVGVMLSGHMNYEDVSRVLPYAKEYADSHGCDVELLFHPGGTDDEKEISQVTFKADREFFLSKNREIEADACCRISKEICV